MNGYRIRQTLETLACGALGIHDAQRILASDSRMGRDLTRLEAAHVRRLAEGSAQSSEVYWILQNGSEIERVG